MIRSPTMADKSGQGDTLSLIRCGLGQESYGLDMTWVAGIHGIDRLRRRPGDDGRVGVLPSYDGDVPVFHLAERLQRAQARADVAQHIVVLKSARQPWGLMVDKVSRVLRVPIEQVQPLARGAGASSSAVFQGVIRFEDSLVLLLAPDQMAPGAEPLPLADSAPASSTLSAVAEKLRSSISPAASTTASKSQGRLVLFSTIDPDPDERPLTFGVSLVQVLEILEPLPWVPVPLAPPHVFGLANWRDRPVPIIDLPLRLGMPATVRDRRTRLLIARAAGEAARVGFLVRPIIRVLNLPVPHRPCLRDLALPPEAVLGSVDLPEETVVIPDIAGLVAT